MLGFAVEKVKQLHFQSILEISADPAMENLLRGIKHFLAAWMIAFPLQQSFCTELPAEFGLHIAGGAHRLFRQGVDRPELEVMARSTDGAPHDLNFGFQIQDLFGRPTTTLPSLVFHVAAAGSKTQAVIPLTLGIGYYTITAHCCEGSSALTRDTDLGIVCPPYPGAPPNYFLSSNLPPQA